MELTIISNIPHWKKKLRSVFIAVALLSTVFRATAAGNYIAEFTPTLQRAYFETQKLRLDAARQLISEARTADHSNVVVAYLENYADLHYLLISEDKKAFQELSKKEEERLDLISELPDSSPFKRFLLAEVRIHWAFAKIKFGSQVSGAWEVIKAYRLLDENRKKFPTFDPTYKTLGLLHILIGSVPDQYQWVTRILGLKGSISLGLSELERVIKNEPLFRQETELINILIHAYTLKLSPDLLGRLTSITKNQPDNLLFHFFTVTTLMKEGKSLEALEYLDDAPRTKNYIAFPFLDYLRGEILLQKGDYATARKSYLSFLSQYRGFNYIKDSYLKLFMSYWLIDQDEQAAPFMLSVEKKGALVMEADQLAKRLAEDYKKGKLTVSQKALFKARYASDGGFLNEAWSAVSKLREDDFPNVSEKAELNYRKGRILQKWARNSQAIPFYLRTMSFTDPSCSAFCATAALQCGYLFEAQNEPEKAANYFKKAISYKNYEYKNSIDNKARAALTAMGK